MSSQSMTTLCGLFGPWRISRISLFLLKDVKLLLSNVLACFFSLTKIRIEGEAPSSTKNRSQVENYNENWPEKGTIDFKNYYVKYRPNLPYVIQDFNLHINHGEKVHTIFSLVSSSRLV